MGSMPDSTTTPSDRGGASPGLTSAMAEHDAEMRGHEAALATSIGAAVVAVRNAGRHLEHLVDGHDVEYAEGPDDVGAFLADAARALRAARALMPTAQSRPSAAEVPDWMCVCGLLAHPGNTCPWWAPAAVALGRETPGIAVTGMEPLVWDNNPATFVLDLLPGQTVTGAAIVIGRTGFHWDVVDDKTIKVHCPEPAGTV
jgi:hypothetical protein